MTYYVLLEHQKDDYQATILGWPDCVAKGTTQQEALMRVRESLTKRLAQSEIVPLEIEAVSKQHVWLPFAGMFADDSLFDEVTEEIENYRRELDSTDGVT